MVEEYNLSTFIREVENFLIETKDTYDYAGRKEKLLTATIQARRLIK